MRRKCPQGALLSEVDHLVLTAYSRVTVVSSERAIDLALPSALPIADVMAQVMRYADPSGSAAVTWTLGRLGGPSLPLTHTLEEAGVLDGDVLELRTADEDVSPARVEDVRDAVEDSVDAAGGVWATPTTRSFAVLAGSGGLAAAGAVAWLSGRLGLSGTLAGLDSVGSAAAATVVLLLATWWASRFARDLDAQVAAGVGLAWAALAGLAAGREADLSRGATLITAAVLVAVVAGVARLLTPAATGHAAFGAVMLAAGVVQGACDTTAAAADQASRSLPVAAVLAVGIVPRVSLAVGGLASADYRVRHVGRLDQATLRARYRASNALLVGSVLALALTAVWGAVDLLHDARPWDRTLALAVAAALVLRSRVFSRTQHMVALRVGGAVVVAYAAARLASEHTETAGWIVAVAAVVVALGLGLASLPMSDISRARVKRTLNAVEFVVVVVTVVLLLGAAGVYNMLGGLF
ncbi:type VII secretion integral membrane protein EccD [Nocardioides sp. DS6]|uniref:Type VII secretion integral membrane protein EccD n=1 Tax=Nocardioides eburneus TaxID=3231482 RepID=A0ABV3T2Y5_9ACTN